MQNAFSGTLRNQYRGSLFFIMFLFFFFSGCYRKNSINFSAKKELNLEYEIAQINNDMVLVEGGSFTMRNAKADIRFVTVDSFFISKKMVTVTQFSYFIAATGYKTNAEKDSGSFVFDSNKWELRGQVNWQCDEHGRRQSVTDNLNPVLHVSPEDAKQFCNWLSKLTRKKFRLPTEAEWEYAARGGNKSKNFIYSGGNNIDEVAWYGGNSGGRVHPVALKKGNELGLYDMSGNAWEWCSDWYSESYYDTSSVKNPTGPKKGEEKICRGGSYLSGANGKGDTGNKEQCMPGYRGKEFNNLGAGDGSFRIVCEK